MTFRSSTHFGMAVRTALGGVAVAVVFAACSTGNVGIAGSAQPLPTSDGANCPTSQPAPLAAGETRTVAIKTSKGSMTLKIDGDLSPIAAGNFVALASCGYYDGVVFHRVVPGFVIQGGDPSGNGTGGPGYTIKDEPVTTPYRRGTLAMARSSEPDSQGSQFFIVLSDEAGTGLALTNTYAIFGEVTDGMATVDAIAAMPNSGEPANAALQPVAMEAVSVSTP